jgi:hypothetical protein
VPVIGKRSGNLLKKMTVTLPPIDKNQIVKSASSKENAVKPKSFQEKGLSPK